MCCRRWNSRCNLFLLLFLSALLYTANTMKMFSYIIPLFLCTVWVSAEERGFIRFNTNFPGGCLGKIVALEAPDSFRCHIPGQYNESGRNRQTSWFFFRIENVKDRDITLVMTDYIGEYNLRPGAVPMKATMAPVCSEDGKTWRHVTTMDWDNEKKEATLRLRPATDVLWIAHVPPYTHDRILQLLDELDASPFVRIEVIGETVERRPLHLVTVTDWNVSDEKKKHLFLMARQHAWEAPTSLMGEGAMRFFVSDDPLAKKMRSETVVSFVPTLDPDGCQSGAVRFNRNGYDLNRHWSTIDLRSKTDLRLKPEVWYAQKAIAALHVQHPIDLLVSLHDQETGDCLMTAVDTPAMKERIQRLEQLLDKYTFFDSTQPSIPIRFSLPNNADSVEALWGTHRIPSTVLEIRVEKHPKLNRHPTCEDYLGFGAGLIRAMGEAVTEESTAHTLTLSRRERQSIFHCFEKFADCIALSP